MGVVSECGLRRSLIPSTYTPNLIHSSPVLPTSHSHSHSLPPTFLHAPSSHFPPTTPCINPCLYLPPSFHSFPLIFLPLLPPLLPTFYSFPLPLSHFPSRSLPPSLPPSPSSITNFNMRHRCSSSLCETEMISTFILTSDHRRSAAADALGLYRGQRLDASLRSVKVIKRLYWGWRMDTYCERHPDSQFKQFKVQ